MLIKSYVNNNLDKEMSELIKETLLSVDKESNRTWNFVIENIELLKKIPVYNMEIKYILKKYNDAFRFVPPEIILNYFIPVICKCVILEKNNISPIEWIDYIRELRE